MFVENDLDTITEDFGSDFYGQFYSFVFFS